MVYNDLSASGIENAAAPSLEIAIIFFGLLGYLERHAGYDAVARVRAARRHVAIESKRS